MATKQEKHKLEVVQDPNDGRWWIARPYGHVDAQGRSSLNHELVGGPYQSKRAAMNAISRNEAQQKKA